MFVESSRDPTPPPPPPEPPPRREPSPPPPEPNASCANIGIMWSMLIAVAFYVALLWSLYEAAAGGTLCAARRRPRAL